jgi:hypothetical protein
MDAPIAIHMEPQESPPNVRPLNGAEPIYSSVEVLLTIDVQIEWASIQKRAQHRSISQQFPTLLAPSIPPKYNRI